MSVTTEFVALLVWRGTGVRDRGLVLEQVDVDRVGVAARGRRARRSRPAGSRAPAAAPVMTGAVKVGFCAVALESVTCSGSPPSSGSPCASTCVHAYVIGSLSGSVEPEPSRVTTLPRPGVWSGPAFATGGVAPDDVDGHGADRRVVAVADGDLEVERRSASRATVKVGLAIGRVREGHAVGSIGVERVAVARRPASTSS